MPAPTNKRGGVRIAELQFRGIPPSEADTMLKSQNRAGFRRQTADPLGIDML